MVAVAELQEGAWTARWSNHVVFIDETNGWWRAVVWYWPASRPHTGRVTVDAYNGFPTAALAVDWAVRVLGDKGAEVLVDGKKQDIRTFLAFAPAPREVR